MDEAIALHEQTLAGRQQLLGESHPSTLASLGNLASAYRAAGRHEEAIPLFDRVLAEAEQLLGGDHPFTLLARSNLTSAYEADGRWN